MHVHIHTTDTCTQTDNKSLKDSLIEVTAQKSIKEVMQTAPGFPDIPLKFPELEALTQYPPLAPRANREHRV